MNIGLDVLTDTTANQRATLMNNIPLVKSINAGTTTVKTVLDGIVARFDELNLERREIGTEYDAVRKNTTAMDNTLREDISSHAFFKQKGIDFANKTVDPSIWTDPAHIKNINSAMDIVEKLMQKKTVSAEDLLNARQSLDHLKNRNFKAQRS
jgi:hypothetical protein